MFGASEPIRQGQDAKAKDSEAIESLVEPLLLQDQSAPKYFDGDGVGGPTVKIYLES